MSGWPSNLRRQTQELKPPKTTNYSRDTLTENHSPSEINGSNLVLLNVPHGSRIHDNRISDCEPLKTTGLPTIYTRKKTKTNKQINNNNSNQQ